MLLEVGLGEAEVDVLEPVAHPLFPVGEQVEHEQLAPDTEPRPMFRFHAVCGESQLDSGCLLEPRDTFFL